MALFRLPSSGLAALAPRGHGLLLRAPQMSDFPQWAQLRESSRAYLTPWEPIWPSDDLTRAGFRRRLRRYAEDIATDKSYPFIVFRGGRSGAPTHPSYCGGQTLVPWSIRSRHANRRARCETLLGQMTDRDDYAEVTQHARDTSPRKRPSRHRSGLRMIVKL